MVDVAAAIAVNRPEIVDKLPAGRMRTKHCRAPHKMVAAPWEAGPRSPPAKDRERLEAQPAEYQRKHFAKAAVCTGHPQPAQVA